MGGCNAVLCCAVLCCAVLCCGVAGVKWKGLSQKLEAAHSFARSLPPEDVILFTDAFDVMFTNSPKHILETYQSLVMSEGKDIIFAGECGCW